MTKYLVSLSMLLASITAYGQVKIYASMGIGGNSGGLVYPYKDSESIVPSIPWLIEAETAYQVSTKTAISLFGQKKENEKGSIFSVGVDSEAFYCGLKGSFTLLEYKAFNLIIAPYAAYGHEQLEWRHSPFSLFGGGSRIEGKDHFHLLQSGVDISAQFTDDRMMFKISVNPAQDFVVDARREISRSSLEHEAFKYEGLFVLNIKAGFGVRLCGR